MRRFPKRYLEQKQKIIVTENKNRVEGERFAEKQGNFIDVQAIPLWKGVSDNFFIHFKKPVKAVDFAFALGWIEEELKNYARTVEEEEKN